MENKFTWGDSVLIKINRPHRFHPGEYASVCGFYQAASAELAQQFECMIGDWI